MAKLDQKGRRMSRKGTYVYLHVLQTPAWCALNSTAQMLWIWLKMEFKGPNNNNNGRIRLSYRQAATRLGVSVNTAAKAFHQLQEKGFLVVTKLGSLGFEGAARGPAYELTDLPLAGQKKSRDLYLIWQENRPFEVVRHKTKHSKASH